MLRLFFAPLLLVSLPAAAGETTLGVGLGGAVDLPDAASTLDGERMAGFGAPSLRVPVRIELTDHVLLRVGARFDLGIGYDRITWTQQINGDTVTFYDDDHRAFLVAGALTTGLDLRCPGDLPVTPIVGASAGVGWFGTYHSLREGAVGIMDPVANDLANPRNIDPYTTQLALVSEVRLGAERALSDRVALGIEIGYSVAFLPARDLEKTLAEYAAQREPYGYNTLSAGVGVTLAL